MINVFDEMGINYYRNERNARPRTNVIAHKWKQKCVWERKKRERELYERETNRQTDRMVKDTMAKTTQQ